MLGHRSLNVEDYLSILKRRWWIVAIPAVIFPIIGVGATYLVTPQYVSSTLVLIDQQKVPDAFVKPVVTEPLDTRIAYYEEQILSRSRIEPIINHYNLYGDQHLSMDARVDLVRTKALHIEAIHSEIAQANGLPGFQISFTASDPHTAQQVCAEITSLFTSENVKAREAAAENTTGFLQERLDDAQRTLNDQDAKVAAFETKYFGELPGDEGNNEGIMSSLSSRLDATTQAIQGLQQSRSVGEALLQAQEAQQQSFGSPAAAVQTPQAQQKQLDDLESQKSALTLQYTSDYPDVKAIDRKIADLRAEMAKAASAPPVVPATPAAPVVNRPEPVGMVQLKAQLHGLDVQIEAKQKEQDNLKRQIQSYESKIQSSPEVEAQYKELTRDSQTALTSYNKLREEMNQSQMTTDLEHRQEGETFTLLDEANLPIDPTYPKVAAFAGAGLGGGIVLGLLIVAFLEYRDIALRTEREVWDFTHLPTLAVIAWSGETAEAKQGRESRIKRLFGRRPRKDALAGAQG